MFVKHFKGQPNDFIIRFRKGKAVRLGNGLEFWYMPYNTVVVAVPTVSQDAPFIFHEATINFQQVAIQGHISFRISDPAKVAERYDFTINPETGAYSKQDLDKLVQRVVSVMKDRARKEINALTLEEALIGVQGLADRVYDNLRNESLMQEAGIEIEALHFFAIEPSPEMREALEAQYRESLKRNADRAIYERRTAAVEEERKIKQSEVQTDIEIEQQRSRLVDLQAENDLKLAEAQAKVEEMKLDPYASLSPQALIGLAFRDFAGNANKIGNLSITPDMLGQIVTWMNTGTAKLPNGGARHEKQV